MTARRARNWGGMWGAGLGLLSLLIVVGLMIYMWSTMAETVTQTGPSGKTALESAKDLKQEMDQRAKNMNKDLGLEPPPAGPYEVVLITAGEKKAEVAQAIRGVTNMPLEEAKGIVDAPPKTVKAGLAKGQAETIKKLLEEAGATAEIRGGP